MALAGFAMLAARVAAHGAAADSHKVILTVTGSIGTAGGDGKAEFTRSRLEALGMVRLKTSTPWSDGSVVFEGVLGRDLLAAVGARGTVVRATALNDYTVEIPVSDFAGFRVILALKMNGRYLSRREKGPVWVIYPWDQNEALRNAATEAKMIWQLRRMNVE